MPAKYCVHSPMPEHASLLVVAANGVCEIYDTGGVWRDIKLTELQKTIGSAIDISKTVFFEIIAVGANVAHPHALLQLVAGDTDEVANES